MSRKLVAYFSASGVTAGLAKTLAEAVGADLYEIRPLAPYTDADLDWNDKQSRSSIEMSDPASRPLLAEGSLLLAEGSLSLAEYDVVFVGFPIWWYVAPTIVNTFLESHDFAGKTIVPFATSGGSGLGDTVERLRPSVSATAVWKAGRLLKRGATRDELAAWARGLGL